MNSGESIKRLRLLMGLNQKGIAIKLGMTQQGYSKLERCKNIDREKLDKILKAMNCCEEELEIIHKLTHNKKI